MKQQYTEEKNIRLSRMLDSESFKGDLDITRLAVYPAVATFPLHLPDEEYRFQHENAIIIWHGIIFCAWYNCPENELDGFTPIRGKFSRDGGKSWSKPEIIVCDHTGKLICCPPVFGICDDELYLLANTMVGPDLIHSMEFYKFDPADEKFHFLKSEPVPFKLNTNVFHLDNGKLLLPGRIAEPDGFPATPAVLIADSGKIDGKWRLVKIQPDKFLPDGAELRNPEITPVIQHNVITMFCRNDHRDVPIFYRSMDFGETWSRVMAHDIPFADSKIYSGTLSDRRNYLIGNIIPPESGKSLFEKRDKLAFFLSEPDTLNFNRGWLLRDGCDKELALYPQWSYPMADEYDGKLYVIYSMSSDGNQSHRGAMLSIIDLNLASADNGAVDD